jgi:hypothetical protein
MSKKVTIISSLIVGLFSILTVLHTLDIRPLMVFEHNSSITKVKSAIFDLARDYYSSELRRRRLDLFDLHRQKESMESTYGKNSVPQSLNKTIINTEEIIKELKEKRKKEKKK